METFAIPFLLFVLLLAATAAVGTLGAFELIGDAEPWKLVGGIGSAICITAGILLFPRLDRYGLLRLPKREISFRRLAGVAFLLTGVVLVQLI